MLNIQRNINIIIVKMNTKTVTTLAVCSECVCVCCHRPCMDWMRFLTVSGRTLRAAHFSIRTGGMWLYMSRLSTDSGSKPRESMNCLQEETRPVGTLQFQFYVQSLE